MARFRQVAVLIETSRHYGREMLRGVMRYQQTHPGWKIYFEPRGYAELMPSWLSDWQGDGILARITSRKMGSLLLSKGIPVIDLRAAFDFGLTSVSFHNDGFVRLALEHLQSRGLKQVAFCGIPSGQNHWIDDRQAEFQRQATQAGLSIHVYESKGGTLPNNQLTDERDRIARWIRWLPRPLGVLAFNDDRGLQVLDACRAIGVRVPEDVAVIGIDNDEFLGNLAQPPLTSVQANVREVGFCAAEQLQRLMTGKKASPEKLHVRSHSLIPRKSTEMLAFDDPEVKQAVLFIRAHACDPISIKHVLAQVPLARRRLEQRFQQVVGHTLHEEICRVRLERARQLLSETNLSVETVAHRVGIATGSHLCNSFKRRYGLTPGQLREQSSLP